MKKLIKNKKRVFVKIIGNILAVAEVECFTETFNLTKFYVTELPFYFCNYLSEEQQEKVVKLLKEIFEQDPSLSKDIITSLSEDVCYIKKINLSTKIKKDFKDKLENEINKIYPDIFLEAKIDFQFLEKKGTSILVCAIKKNILESYLNLFRESGLSVKLVDCDVFAIFNSLKRNFPEFKIGKKLLVYVREKNLLVYLIKNGNYFEFVDLAIEKEKTKEDLCKNIDKITTVLKDLQEKENLKDVVISGEKQISNLLTERLNGSFFTIENKIKLTNEKYIEQIPHNYDEIFQIIDGLALRVNPRN